MKMKFGLGFLIVSALAIGCGQTNTEKPGDGKKGVGGQQNKFILAQEPSGAKGVIEVKQEAKNGDEVVVVGRIGGSKAPFTGRAAFTIVDRSLKVCSELEGDTCLTPWDYCCEATDSLARATVLVKFVDEQGKTLAQDAKEAMGLEELQTVVIRGVARRDDGITVLATGLYIKK